MTTYRGLDGFLSLGGKLTGSPQLNGAEIAGSTDLAIDGGGGNLYGVVVLGDQFTIAGESGSPVHTVTGARFRVPVANAIASITFTPAIASGGVADNAAVTFVSNSVAEAKLHVVNSEVEVLDATIFGTKWRTKVGGLGNWTGSATCWLDKGDANQSELIGKLAQATPSPTIDGVLFGVTTSKQWYGGCFLSNLTIVSDIGALVEVTFNFEGDGAILPDWH